MSDCVREPLILILRSLGALCVSSELLWVAGPSHPNGNARVPCSLPTDTEQQACWILGSSIFFQSMLSSLCLQTGGSNAMSCAADEPGPSCLPVCSSALVCQGCSSLHHLLAWKSAAHPSGPSSHVTRHRSPSACPTSTHCAHAPADRGLRREGLYLTLVVIHLNTQMLVCFSSLRSPV